MNYRFRLISAPGLTSIYINKKHIVYSAATDNASIERADAYLTGIPDEHLVAYEHLRQRPHSFAFADSVFSDPGTYVIHNPQATLRLVILEKI